MNIGQPPGTVPAASLTKKHYLGIGEYYLTTEPERIITVVGSCLALTMYAPSIHMAGMLHAVLPHCNHHTSSRYGGVHQANCVTFLFYMMLEKFKDAGVPVSSIEMKAFGCASSFHTGMPSVGARNIDVFDSIVAREKLNIAARDLGGSEGRKVLIDTANGDVYVRMLAKNDPELVTKGVVIE
ncbi:MAG: chemotaxis protein CheD [Spirochaetes bacterium]|nr:chemotaxis protein CheD [Spirochaetota bacterium]